MVEEQGESAKIHFLAILLKEKTKFSAVVVFKNALFHLVGSPKEVLEGYAAKQEQEDELKDELLGDQLVIEGLDEHQEVHEETDQVGQEEVVEIHLRVCENEFNPRLDADEAVLFREQSVELTEEEAEDSQQKPGGHSVIVDLLYIQEIGKGSLDPLLHLAVVIFIFEDRDEVVPLN